MFDFLLKGKYQPIALDIGSDSIKMLQMQQMGRIVSVNACGRWRFPDTATDPAQRREMAVTAIRDMLKRGGFKGKNVISSLNGSQLTIKNVRMPHMSEKELQTALPWEAKERFDFDVQAGQLSYLNAGEVRQGTETRDEIILLAAPHTVVDEHLSILEDAGLRALHVDAEPIALFRTYDRFLRRKNDEQTVSVIVDIGLSATRLVVSRGRNIVFLKNIDIGGRKFTEVVAAHLNLTFTEAGELRMRIMREHENQDRQATVESNVVQDRNSVEWTVFDAIRAEVEVLAREIALCLRYCSVTFRGLRCQSVTLSGGEAYDPAVSRLLSQNLNIPCTIGQPLRGIDVSGLDFGNRRGMLAEWAVCSGLAIREMDATVTTNEVENGESRVSA